MLNKANNLLNKQMKDREALAEKCYATIRDAQEALHVLGYEVASLDEVIPTITINKGRIVEVQVTNDEEIEQLYKEIGRHIGRINQLSAENEELREELAAVLASKETNEPITMEGGDAMTSPLQEAKDAVEAFLNGRSFNELTMDEIGTLSDLQDRVKQLEKQQEEEARKAKLPEYSLNYTELTFDETIDSRTMFGIYGTITIEDKEYAFKATNNHSMPIIYGCFDMDTIQLAKDIITNDVEKFNFINEEENGMNFSHINDTEDRLVVWRLTDDKGNVNYHGYTDKYILTWDKAKFANHPGRKLIKNAFSTKPNMWKKVPNAKLADKFMAVCESIWPEDFTNDDNDPEPTKAVIRITKEQPQTTNDELSNMIHERHQRAKENRIPDLQTAIKYEGPIDDFTPITNDDDYDFSADDDLDF